MPPKAKAKDHPPGHWTPRYKDGQRTSPEDRVTLGAGEARLLWTRLVQEVPPAWVAVLDGAGTVPLSDLRLIRRGP